MPNDSPLFSIIMPTYNCGEKLAATVDSVLSQADGLAEMIVVDGGSKDGVTKEVIARYGDRIRSLSEPDKGLYDAMNKGIGMARGRYLNFQGAGDTLRPGVLAALAPQMPDDALWFVYGRVFLKAANHEHGEPFTKMTLRNGNIPHQGVFYERSVFDVVGTYNLRYRTGADYEMAMRCYHEDRVHKKYIDMVIADFEGEGVSTVNPDLEINRDLPGLIWKYLGPVPYFAWRASRLIPMHVREARVRKRRLAERAGGSSH